jgi:hypothetical protein
MIVACAAGSQIGSEDHAVNGFAPKEVILSETCKILHRNEITRQPGAYAIAEIVYRFL